MKCGEAKPAEQFAGKSKTCNPCKSDRKEDRQRRKVWTREDKNFASRLARGFDLMNDD